MHAEAHDHTTGIVSPRQVYDHSVWIQASTSARRAFVWMPDLPGCSTPGLDAWPNRTLSEHVTDWGVGRTLSNLTQMTDWMLMSGQPNS